MRHKGFLRDDSGQDLIEYTLLLAMICLASAGLFISSGGTVSGISFADDDFASGRRWFVTVVTHD